MLFIRYNAKIVTPHTLVRRRDS